MARPEHAACKARRALAACAALAALCLLAPFAQAQDGGSAIALHARYTALSGQLASNAFRLPIVLDSSEQSDSVKGEIYAVVDYPFATVSSALSGADRWCEVLMLHLNTKYCRANTGTGGTILTVNIGKKFDQPLKDSYRVQFLYSVAAARPDYLRIPLTAVAGPMGTRDYRIMLEAIPLEGKTFIHLAYSYGFGFAGKMAMQVYLGTIGASKVGFTVEGRKPDGQPNYIGGMRGLVERNTMRYYLAIDAYLGSLAVPAPAQLDKRLQDWFAAAERYPRQLHEMDRADYLAMKHSEFQRLKVAG